MILGMPINTIMRCGSASSMSTGETAIRAGSTVGWYDSQDLTTLTLGGGNAVSSWRDKLGSGHDLLQADGAKQPIQSTNGVLFDGTNFGDYMQTLTFTLNQPVFIYMLLRQITWVNIKFPFDGFTDNSAYLLQSTTTPDLLIAAGSDSSRSSDLAVNTWGIIRAYFNGASSKFIVDNHTPITGNFGAANMAGITLGASGSGGNNANVQIYEAVYRSSDVSETDIYAYFETKKALL